MQFLKESWANLAEVGELRTYKTTRIRYS